MFEEKGTDNDFKRTPPMMSRRKILLLVFILVLLFPFPTTVVPEWKVRVADQNGKPFVGESVMQSWKHYSLDWSGCCDNTETRTTDENGVVIFPKRTIWAGLLRRLIFPMWAEVMSLAHGSTGIHSYIWVKSYSMPKGTKDYVVGELPPQEIILPR